MSLKKSQFLNFKGDFTQTVNEEVNNFTSRLTLRLSQKEIKISEKPNKKIILHVQNKTRYENILGTLMEEYSNLDREKRLNTNPKTDTLETQNYEMFSLIDTQKSQTLRTDTNRKTENLESLRKSIKILDMNQYFYTIQLAELQLNFEKMDVSYEGFEEEFLKKNFVHLYKNIRVTLENKSDFEIGNISLFLSASEGHHLHFFFS